jgi:hypothetical protein
MASSAGDHEKLWRTYRASIGSRLIARVATEEPIHGRCDFKERGYRPAVTVHSEKREAIVISTERVAVSDVRMVEMPVFSLADWLVVLTSPNV